VNIYLDMVGCRLNQAEIEQMARQFRAQGHAIVSEAGRADLAVINTCAVTGEAAADSRQKIRHAAREGAGDVAVTGCWSSLVPAQALSLPGVKHVVPNERKDSLVAELLGLPVGEFDREPILRAPLPGLRQRTRGFVKVQDGCDNACTFCITTLARGTGRSRPAAEVVAEIRATLQGGVQEIVLTGVHLGSWGADGPAELDRAPQLHLRDLVKATLDGTDVPRLRLSSLEPWDLDAGFFSLWQDARLMPHLHLPLQSGSAATLRRMRRKTSPASFRALAAAARAAIPDVALTTDVIAGFPGETDAEFEETLAFIREIGFTGGHVFSYSARPGTAAARMRGQVPHELRRQRSRALREVFAEMGRAYRQQFVGRTLPVLWEASAVRSEQGWQIEGLTGNYLRVTASAPELRWNHLDEVKLLEVTEDGMRGELLGAQ
jgi:threonylcarbamoyladenosine tRNA methylthiotransferase MtaB